MNTYNQNKILQKEMRRFVVEQGADYFVTIAFNRNTSMNAARHKLCKWHAYVDKKLLGKYWCEEDADKRLNFTAFAEHINSNLHWHLLVRLADESRAEIFEHVANKCWRKLVKGGDVDVRKLYEELDVKKTCNYATKDIWQTENYNSVIFSNEFLAK